ncbi:MAG: superoxide dismutase, partial [Luteolibacter sp.]
MENLPHFNRRHFVKLGTLAATAVAFPNLAGAATSELLTLSPLPYATDALEPHIDKLTMEIHHGKHHAAYVKNYNAALAIAPDLAKQPLDTILAALPSIADESLRTTLRNNGGGHWNHDFFWKTLSPENKSGKPSAELLAAISTA